MSTGIKKRRINAPTALNRKRLSNWSVRERRGKRGPARLQTGKKARTAEETHRQRVQLPPEGSCQKEHHNTSKAKTGIVSIGREYCSKKNKGRGEKR